LRALDFEGLPVSVMRWFSVGEKEEERTFAFAHPLLAEGFKGAIGREAEGMEQKLVKWCGEWERHKSPYALRYLPEHLRERRERWEGLFELAQDEGFAQRTRFAPKDGRFSP
jgi:1,4-dihydroxy-2-naphthoyl-CoA synthase